MSTIRGSCAARTAFGALAAMALAPSASGVVTQFYWTNGWTSPINSGSGPAGTINRVDAGGANPTVIATLDSSGNPLFRVCDVEIDQTRSVIYWNNWNSQVPMPEEAIYRSDLNGGSQTLFTSANSSPTTTDSGLHRIAIDETTGDVYFTRAVSYANPPEVSRVDVNGANYTKLFSAVNDGWFTSGVTYDTVNDKVYWGDSGVFGTVVGGAVNVMNDDGTGQATLVPWGGGNGQGRSLAVDPNAGAQGTVFFSAWTTAGGVLNGPQNGGGGIWSYDIATAVVTPILIDPTTGIPDIEVDPFDQRIYWTDYVRNEIRSSRYDGTDLQIEVANLLNPFGLALNVVPAPGAAPLGALGALALTVRRRR